MVIPMHDENRAAFIRAVKEEMLTPEEELACEGGDAWVHQSCYYQPGVSKLNPYTGGFETLYPGRKWDVLKKRMLGL